jgi:hypothetical protein
VIGNLRREVMKRIIPFFVVVFTFVFCLAAFGEEPEEPKTTFPLGYPWSTWGEISETPVGHQETGFKIDGYAEQGVDWFKLGKTEWTFNTFIGIRGTVSSRKSDYWNNRVGPWAGIKFKEALNIGEGNWGEIDLGVRWEYYHYLGREAPQSDDNRVVFFFEWSFGGNWRKSK